jgi:hypothetical protein
MWNYKMVATDASRRSQPAWQALLQYVIDTLG